MVGADETTPEFRDIYINDIICSGASRAMYFNGIPEKNISGIFVEDCEIVSDRGADIRYSDGVTLKNVRIRQSVGEGFVLANCRNVTMTGCSDASSDGTVSVKKYNSSDVTVE